MLHDDLLSVARQLALIDASGKPRQASLRRSVSTAYYALFHALCDVCVTELVGWKRPRPGPDFWAPVTPVYRSVDHASARRSFSNVLQRPAQSSDLRQLAARFLKLQEMRLRADYDPSLRLLRSTALEHVEEAEQALELLKAVATDMRLQLAIQLVTKLR